MSVGVYCFTFYMLRDYCVCAYGAVFESVVTPAVPVVAFCRLLHVVLFGEFSRRLLLSGARIPTIFVWCRQCNVFTSVCVCVSVCLCVCVSVFNSDHLAPLTSAGTGTAATGAAITLPPPTDIPKIDTPGPNWVLKTDADKARLSTVGKPPSKYDDARCDFTGCPPDVPFIYYATPHRNRAFSYRRLLLTAQHDIEVSNVIPQACVCAV